MYSYVALTWDTRAATFERTVAAAALQQQLQSLVDFQTVLAAPGICIVQKSGLHSACGACVLPNDSGAILGTLFATISSDMPQRRQTVTADEAEKIVQSQGSHLITHFWGRYVAFIRNPRTHGHLAIRDPSGMLPCYQTSHRGVQIWFSCLDDLATLGLPETTIDWRYVQTHVVMRAVSRHQTALTGINEVMAGQGCEITGEAISRSTLWDPISISSTDVIEDSDVAARTLRAVTKACVNAWAASYPGILHTLSGGLDSSIVAVLLGQTPARTPVTCVNYFTNDLPGDERGYARLASQQAGFDLIEKRRASRLVDLKALLKIATTPNPWMYIYQIEHTEYEHAQVQRLGAGAIFTGGGGDGIFYQARTALSVSDYVQRHGITSRLARIALDAARIEGQSLTTILWEALTERRSASRNNPSVEHAHFKTLVSAETIASQGVLLEKTFAEMQRRNVPLGKRWHITTTSVPPRFYDHFGGPLAVERIAPFVSQPIVELCLRIPTYVLVENGWDRAIARRAFQDDLPRPIVNRRGKGRIESHVRAIFNANIKFIREFLLDGELARRGILNRPHVEHCLSGGSVEGPEFTEIQDHLSTEAWIHSQRKNAPADLPV